MRFRAGVRGGVICVVVMCVSGCAVDSSGLASSKTDAVAPSNQAAKDATIPSDGGTGGRIATASGGATGTGGQGSDGADEVEGPIGIGGGPGTGGVIGTGGTVGTGGTAGTGGITGTGGRANSGGAGAAAGAGAGGALGQGGSANQACNATTCANGCCRGNVCVTARTQQSCGNAGAACAPCAACFQCGTTGACEVDRASSWTVTCVSASVAANKTGGAAWDPSPTSADGAAPDPYCEFQQNEVGLRDTDTALDSLTPTWNQNITPRGMTLTPDYLIGEAGAWSILVADYDGGVNDDRMCQFFPRLTASSFSAGGFSFTNQASCNSVSLKLSCNQ